MDKDGIKIVHFQLLNCWNVVLIMLYLFCADGIMEIWFVFLFTKRFLVMNLRRFCIFWYYSSVGQLEKCSLCRGQLT